MSDLPGSMDFGWLIVATVFVSHIVANLLVTNRGSAPIRVENLSLFPPFWVFGVWVVIWGLQAMLLFQSFGSGLWTSSMTLLFVSMCAGNIGSQLAGARGWGASVYLFFLGVMLLSSLGFMKSGEANFTSIPSFEAASQLYVGWAMIAWVVGLGVVLVCDRQVVGDALYSGVGLGILLAIPTGIWWSWSQNLADYRVVSAPFLMVLLALMLRAFGSRRRMVQLDR